MRAHNPGLWLALSALSFFPFALDSFELPHQLVLAIGALFCASQAARGRAIVLAAGAVLLLAGLTTATSSAPGLSLPALVTLVVLAAFVGGTGPADLAPVLWTTWPIAAWAIAQAAGHDPLEWAATARWCGGVRPFASLGHPTQLGVWTALVTVLALDRRARWTALVAAMTCVLTLSRAGWLALVVGVAAWAWLRPGVRLRPRGLLTVGAALTLPVALVGPGALLERLVHFFTAPTRWHLAATAWHGFLQHPVLGWGLDTFVLVDQQYRHADAWRYEWGGTAMHAHSFVPQVLATQGALGLLVITVLVALVGWRWWRMPEGARRPGEQAVALAAGAASMVCFLGVPVTALGLLALGSSLRLPPARWRLATPLAAAALVLTALSFAASLAGREALTREGELAHAQRWLTLARRLEPWNALWPTRLGAALEWGARRGSADFTAARRAYEAGAALAPGLAIYEANIGRAASEAGDASATRQWFDRARRHAPLDARIARDAAEASLRVGDLELAEAALRFSLDAYPTDGPAWLTLASLRLRQRRPVEARAALEASLAADWRDWPEGSTLARGVLAELLDLGGDAVLAGQVARGPAVVAPPAEICGAPSLLAR